MIYETIVSRTPIDKGWSGDRKYCAVGADGRKYLLRVSAPERYDRRKQEYARMKQLEPMGISISKALELGMAEEGVYILTDWINGADAGDVLPGMGRETQYQYGTEAGRMLQILHSLPAPEDAPDWEAAIRSSRMRPARPRPAWKSASLLLWNTSTRPR